MCVCWYGRTLCRCGYTVVCAQFFPLFIITKAVPYVSTEEYKNSIDFIYFFRTDTQSGVSVRLNFFDHREKVLSYQKVLPVRSQMLYG